MNRQAMKEKALQTLPKAERAKFLPVISAGKVYLYDKEEYLKRQRESQRKNATIYAKRRKEKRARKLLEDPVIKQRLLDEIKQEAKAGRA